MKMCNFVELSPSYFLLPLLQLVLILRELHYQFAPKLYFLVQKIRNHLSCFCNVSPFFVFLLFIIIFIFFPVFFHNQTFSPPHSLCFCIDVFERIRGDSNKHYVEEEQLIKRHFKDCAKRQLRLEAHFLLLLEFSLFSSSEPLANIPDRILDTSRNRCSEWMLLRVSDGSQSL